MIISFRDLTLLLLIMARLGGLFAFAPVYSSRNIPAGIKSVFVFWIAITILYVIPPGYAIPQGPLSLITALILEVCIGVLLGLICYFTFIAIQAAGEIIDLQMGLSVATMFDPLFGATVSIIGRLSFYFGLIMFLILNGHHYILQGLIKSFEIMPVGSPIHLSPVTLGIVLDIGTNFWVMVVKLAAPAVMLIFLSDFAFGIVSRVAPQVNVFMLGFQVKPSLGLIAIIFSISLLTKHIGGIIGTLYGDMLRITQSIK